MVVATLFLGSCYSLKQPTAVFNSSLDGYKYVFITPIAEKQSVEGVLLGDVYGVYGGTRLSSVNPTGLISEHFIKRGSVGVPEIRPENVEKTIIVNYCEDNSGEPIPFLKRGSVIIQMISADKDEIISVCTGEAAGSTGAEAISKANIAMEELFKQDD